MVMFSVLPGHFAAVRAKYRDSSPTAQNDGGWTGEESWLGFFLFVALLV